MLQEEKKKEKLFQLGYLPKEDITVWELARVQGLIMELDQINRPLPESALKEIPEDVLRHFQVNDVTEQFEQFLQEHTPAN